MSILESMRSGTDSTFMQVILALVVVSFVFWYAKPQGDVAAERANVNGTRIMSPDVDKALRLQLRGRTPRSDEEWASAQAAMTDELVKQELIRQSAKRSGLELDVDRDSRLSRTIAMMRRANPDFTDEDGKFDEELYRSAIKYYQYTADEYEAYLQKQVVMSKMTRLMAYGVVIPDQMLRDAYVEQQTRARVQFVRIRPSNFNDQVAVDEAAVTAWMDNNPGSVDAAYAADADAYAVPETVNVRMLVFKLTGDGQGPAELRPRLAALRDQIAASPDPDATMADLARKWSEHISADDGGSLGTLPISDLSEEILSGISGVEAGQLSDIVFTDSMVALYRVNERSEARTQPLDEVKFDIAARLMREAQTPAMAAAFAEELRAGWATNGVADRERLDELNIPVQTSEYLNAASPPSSLAPPPSLVKDALRASPGDVLPQVYQAGDALFVAVLDDIEQADMAAFETERDAIRRQVVEARRQEFLTDWIDGLKAEANL